VIDNNLKIQKSQPRDVNVHKSVDAAEDVNEVMQYQRTDIITQSFIILVHLCIDGGA